MIHVETNRLLLRDWIDGDLEPFAALNGDANVMAHFPAPLSRVQSDGFVRRIQHGLDHNGFGLYGVEVKATGGFIGFVGFSRVGFKAAFTPAVEIGWRLAFPDWGQGYATEAAKACLAHGFGELGFDALVSFTTRGNQRSIAVMERIGMTRNPADDFECPSVPRGHAQRPHVLYRIENPK
ncbi:MAG: GNAT family N-acetyltransferase [Alphaproteobacteria bacterium]